MTKLYIKNTEVKLKNDDSVCDCFVVTEEHYDFYEDIKLYTYNRRITSDIELRDYLEDEYELYIICDGNIANYALHKDEYITDNTNPYFVRLDHINSAVINKLISLNLLDRVSLRFYDTTNKEDYSEYSMNMSDTEISSYLFSYTYDVQITFSNIPHISYQSRIELPGRTKTTRHSEPFMLTNNDITDNYYTVLPCFTLMGYTINDSQTILTKEELLALTFDYSITVKPVYSYPNSYKVEGTVTIGSGNTGSSIYSGSIGFERGSFGSCTNELIKSIVRSTWKKGNRTSGDFKLGPTRGSSYVLPQNTYKTMKIYINNSLKYTESMTGSSPMAYISTYITSSTSASSDAYKLTFAIPSSGSCTVKFLFEK